MTGHFSRYDVDWVMFNPDPIGVHQCDNLAPLLFNIFFQAALESLEKVWTSNGLTKPSFRWFPTAKSGKLRGRLLRQKQAAGQPFSFEKSLYVDDGAFLFDDRNALQTGAKLIFSHFRRFGLKMHIGTDGTFTDSKTEAVFFPSATQSITSADTSPVYVNETGYVTYSDKFKYLGSYVTQDLSDTFDVKNRVLQATKALGAMMPNVFRNPH